MSEKREKELAAPLGGEPRSERRMESSRHGHPRSLLRLGAGAADAYTHGLRRVQFARPNGMKPTARLCGTPVPTARKWLRRYRQHGLSRRREQSRAPPRPPRTPPRTTWKRSIG